MKQIECALATIAILAGFLAPSASGRAPAQGALPCEGQKVMDLIGRFGWSAELDAEVAVVGAPHATHMGATYGAAVVYEYSGGSWQQTARLLPASAQMHDNVGESVSVRGKQVLVGAPNHNPGGHIHAGAAYVFEKQGASWVEAAKLTALDPHISDHFGVSVAIDGDTAIVGAYHHDQAGTDSGATYVFEFVDGAWIQTQRLRPADLQAGDSMGFSVAIQSDWLVAGALASDAMGPNSGAAYVYQRTPNGWSEFKKLVAWDGQPNEYFSTSVAISNSLIAIGAPSQNGPATSSGAVYLFRYDGFDWVPLQKLKAPDAGFLTRLGISVALDGDRLLAGADSDADGITGSGSAYIFRDYGSGYVVERKLRAPDAALNQFFGRAVGLSNETALVGAYNDVPGSAWFFQAPAFARSYCFGVPCPCGNDDPVRGCARQGAHGAALSACGSASVALDDLAFGASGLAPAQPALLFRGRSELELPFGDGRRCAGGEVRRLGLVPSDPAGTAAFGPGLAPLGEWQPGERMYFQLFYRDPETSACGAAFNTTHGLEIHFAP